MAAPTLRPRRISLLILFTLILDLATVLSFSSGRVRVSSSNFPKAASKFELYSRVHSNKSSLATGMSKLFTAQAVVPEVKRGFIKVPGILYFIGRIRKSIARAIAIFSFAFLAVVSNPAVAWGKAAETTVAKVQYHEKFNKKCIKFIVSSVAVAAGAATANRVRGLFLNTSDDQTALTASTNTSEDKTDANLKISIGGEPLKHESVVTHHTPTGTPLVKDLDSKIERLREQERLALQHAEENARKAEQMAKEEAANQKIRIEEQIEKIAEEETNRIAATEKEKEEQLKIAQEKIAAVEKERLEFIAEQKFKAEQAMIEEEMKHKVNQSSEPSHVDESRILVETLSAKKYDNEESRKLSEKYAAMSDEERAFNVLADLGMVEIHPDEFSDADDDNVDPSNVFL